VDDWRTWIDDVPHLPTDVARWTDRKILMGISWAAILATRPRGQHPDVFQRDWRLVCPRLFSTQGGQCGPQRGGVACGELGGVSENIQVTIPLPRSRLVSRTRRSGNRIFADDPFDVTKDLRLILRSNNLAIEFRASGHRSGLLLRCVMLGRRRIRFTDNALTRCFFVERMSTFGIATVIE